MRIPHRPALALAVVFGLSCAVSIAGQQQAASRPRESAAQAPARPSDESPRQESRRRMDRGERQPEASARRSLPTEDPTPSEITPTLDVAWVNALKWRSIGPANMGGRITDVAVDPENPHRFFVATASGGLLKTVNNGVTWEYLFDKEGVASIGDVTIAPSNPDIVWVGTGEANPRNSVSFGDGVYKSTDGGKTWTHMGLRESFQIGRIAIHPTNPDIVYVAAMGRCWGPGGDRGLFRTEDGGKTWDHVINIDEKTGCIDVVICPDDPNLVLAAAWERQRDIYDTNDPAKRWGPGSGLYRSTDGKTFTRVTQGLPSCDLGRIGLDWYLKDPKTVFAVVDCVKIGAAQENAAYMGLTGENADAGARVTRVVSGGPAAEAGLKVGDIVVAVNGEPVTSYEALLAKIRERAPGDKVTLTYAREREPKEAEVTLGKRPGDGSDRPFAFALGGQAPNIQEQQGSTGHEYGGVYKSTDGGETWTRINSLNPRPMYFSKIRVDPSNDQNLWVLGVNLHISRDGGKTFRDDGAPGVHADHHAMWVNPKNGNHLILGCDGGIYMSYDGGKAWDHLNNAAIGQFYHVAIDQRPLYYVYGGLQDNGSWGAPHRTRSGTGPLNEDWFRIGGGDGFVCAVDPDDPDQIYYESQNGGTAWRNLRTGQGGSVRPTPPPGTRYRFNWRTPFILSHHNSKIYYNAGNYVFRTYQAGRSVIKRISPEITRTDRGSATALADSPLDPDVLYVGTDDGALWMTRDGGKTWYDLYKGLPPEDQVASTEPRRPRGAARGQAGFGDLMSRFDENNDGKLQRSELPGQMGRMFDDADANSDGVLDRDEVAALTQRFAGGQGQGPGRRGGAAGGEEEQETPAEGGDGAGAASSTQPAEQPTPGAGTGRPTPGRPDTVAGVWRATLTDETPRNLRNFEITIEPREGETVGGEIRTEMGNYPATGTFDPTSGNLRLLFDGPGGEATLEAKLESGKFTGRMSVARTGLAVSFEAERAPRQTAGAESRRPGRGSRPTAPAGRPLSELVPEPRYVASIEASRYEAGRVYVCLDGHRFDDDRPYLLVSEDFGRTWRSLNANLPKVWTRVLREDIRNPDVLYCGTETGCYVSVNRGKDWTRLNSNMPTVPVHEFAQHTRSGDLIAATHGRSLWILDATPLRQMTPEAIAATFNLFKPANVIAWRSEPQRGVSGARPYRAANPPASAQIVYSLKSEAEDVQVRITTPDGTTVRTLANPPKEAGLHVLQWDLRRDPPQARQGGGRGAPAGAGQAGGGGRRFGGARAAPGVYRVVLTVDGQEKVQEFRVESDPDFPELAAAEDEFDEAEFEEQEEEEEAAFEPSRIVY